MTDKEKIRKEVQRLMDELIQEQKNGYGYDADYACILELQNILTYIDSLQKEPVSEDLKEEINRYIEPLSPEDIKAAPFCSIEDCARHFANWQKQQEQSIIELAEDHAMFAGMTAEERALEAYPPKFTEQKRYSKRIRSEKTDVHQSVRTVYIKGYHQAEKDLELSWEDIPELLRICEELKTSWWFRDNEQTKKIGTQVFWEEVLKRFREMKGE